MNGTVGGASGQFWTTVGGLPDGIEEPSENGITHGDTDRGAHRTRTGAAAKSRGVVERHCANCQRIEMLLNFSDKRRALFALDLDTFIHPREPAVRKSDIDDRAVDRGQVAGEPRIIRLRLCHRAPAFSALVNHALAAARSEILNNWISLGKYGALAQRWVLLVLATMKRFDSMKRSLPAAGYGLSIMAASWIGDGLATDRGAGRKQLSPHRRRPFDKTHEALRHVLSKRNIARFAEVAGCV